MKMEVKSTDTKLSWSDLKSVVNDLRRQLSSLSTMVPTSISFRTLQDGRTRIYFLSTPQNGWEMTLLYTDVPNSSEGTSLRLQSNCRRTIIMGKEEVNYVGYNVVRNS
uniref:Uncharacterized protein n=1 Tax=Photinus pyralis TaxID=7054 RepID=A0A1Y1MHP1_PHOPY